MYINGKNGHFGEISIFAENDIFTNIKNLAIFTNIL